jgi:hypothetical protein
MELDFDLTAEVVSAVADADSGLRFAGRLAAATTGRSLTPDDGYPDWELSEAQERLGVVMPGVLRRLNETLGRRGDLVRVQDRLLAPDELSTDPTGAVMQWRVENQGCGWWGIPLDVLTDEDPPVLVRAADELRWHPYLDRLSLAIVEMLLSEALFTGYEGSFGDNRELDEDSLRALESQFVRLPFPDCPMWTDPFSGVVWRWFAGPGVVLREDAGTWVWVLARSELALNAVHALMPGDWQMQSTD